MGWGNALKAFDLPDEFAQAAEFALDNFDAVYAVVEAFRVKRVEKDAVPVSNGGFPDP